MKKNILPLILLLIVATSCSDWLDVRGRNIQKEQDQFSNYKGFRDALTGCYMTMGSTDIYGQRLTMTDIENMADLWYTGKTDENDFPLNYYLSNHQYDADDARASIKAIYAKLFTTISSANVILKNIKEKGQNITDSKARAVIEGEAYAIRAYCQLDVLRLFGQLPNGGSKTVSLPYSEVTSIDNMPAYYSYNDYVAKLKADIESSENLLKDNDPIFSSTFTELNSPDNHVQDDYMYYRQSRLNYWAVRSLHARMDLYIGNNTEAHDIALDIINAKGSDGNSLISLSGVSDLPKGYNGLPSECLFYLSKYNILDYANNLLIGGTTAQARDGMYFISSDMLTDLYSSIPGATASHNRYLYEWNRQTKNPSGSICPALKKYWYDSNKANANNLSTMYQIIPMIRLSEMYLIAIEASTSLPEAQSLYDTYMKSCTYTLYQPFTSLDDVKTEVKNEYRREFFGEGQMFFTYKRLASKSMLWNNNEITEDNYILPLPSSEYDPSNSTKK